MAKMKIAVITDFHAAAAAKDQRRRVELAENLLARAVRRFNRWVKPDIVIVAGDIVDGGDSESAYQYLARMHLVLNKLTCPYIAVRGNHDPGADYFYKVFARAEQFDVKGVRFVVFDDPEEPNFCAKRTSEQIARFKTARSDFDGLIVAVQHVPLFPPAMADCPYNYTNAGQIIAEMEKYRIFLSISGHYHNGLGLIQHRGMNFVSAPAICEAPFRYMIIEIDNEQISVSTDCFQMPGEIGLVDRHIHTQLAYCSENMDVAEVLKLYKDFGLAGVGFAEHSGQLYFDEESYFNGFCHLNGIGVAVQQNNRMQQYFELMKMNNVSRQSIGLELDFDFQNRPIVADADRTCAGFLIGAVHRLVEFYREKPDYKEVVREFIYRTEAVTASGIDVLAHPFRLFYRAGIRPPAKLFDRVVRILKKNNVAAEMNFHSQENELEFFEKCIDSGVKICLSTDSHNLAELGELWPHLKLLEKIGASKQDLNRILF